MATTEELVQRLHSSKPPASDPFTYLTIIETSLTPAILPALQDILDDAKLTVDIGWDLVEMLVPVPGSAECLERIARLGNPREVILKVLEVMDKSVVAAEKEHNTEPEEEKAKPEPHHHGVDKFVTLVGMLKILHPRLQVRAPSRFLHTSLDTVLRAYDPTSPEATAAVIDLARSLSGQKRPPLPTRQSSTLLETPFKETDVSQLPPDPEADKTEKEDPHEQDLMERLLQCFITCIIEAYVNSNSMEWASRLLEYTQPEKIVPRRHTMMQAYNEVPELQAMDALMGQLVAVAGDLSLTKLSTEEIKKIFRNPRSKDPLSADDGDPEHPEVIQLNTGGFACLTAYWMFAAAIFDAHYIPPHMDLFPDHYQLLQNFLEEDSQEGVVGNPGTCDAIIAMALWLLDHKGISSETDGEKNFMRYHHLLTLIAVLHPNIRIRNAAVSVAGSILHLDPDEDDRLVILEDLLENCVFPTLKACGVEWVKEEIIAAKKNGGKGRFANSTCFEVLQYHIFPDLTALKDADGAALLDLWTQNSAFHLKVANFALFLFGENYKDMVPAGMGTAIEHRYAAPLIQASKTLQQSLGKKELEDVDNKLEQELVVQLAVVHDTLEKVPLH